MSNRTERLVKTYHTLLACGRTKALALQEIRKAFGLTHEEYSRFIDMVDPPTGLPVKVRTKKGHLQSIE